MEKETGSGFHILRLLLAKFPFGVLVIFALLPEYIFRPWWKFVVREVD